MIRNEIFTWFPAASPRKAYSLQKEKEQLDCGEAWQTSPEAGIKVNAVSDRTNPDCMSLRVCREKDTASQLHPLVQKHPMSPDRGTSCRTLVCNPQASR